MKIHSKISIGYSLAMFLIILAFYGMTVYENASIRDKEVLLHLENIKTSFSVLIKQDIKTLATGLQIIIQDPGIREKFTSNDRDALYRYVTPLFKNLKEKFGITHFYFILPDGNCFLRLHDKDIYGDMINRYTFQKSRKTQSLATGIELGKTAFALRAVIPYYDRGKLIGYVELGEEINHFIEIMREQTGAEYAIIAHKNRLDREDWRSLRNLEGLRDNWDDMENRLLVSRTSNDKLLENCLDEKSIVRAEKGENILRNFKNESGSYVCTGFGINDAAEVPVGEVLSPVDITHFTSSMEQFNKNTMIFLGILLLISIVGIILFSASITRPLFRLENAAKNIRDGDFETIADIKSNDEIETLVDAFNKMAVALQTSISGLEQDITERKKVEEELRQSSAELAKSNEKLQDALANIKTLSGMLPICSYCKKIRDDKGYWDQVDSYITKHTETVFSHGMCPECAEKAMKEFEEFKKNSGQ